MKDLKSVIIAGITTGWIVYALAVFYSQSALENKISEVKIFHKLFQNDPGLAATVRHSIETSGFNNLRSRERDGFNVMAWRIMQNLGVIAAQDRPKQMSTFVNSSLGEIIKANKLDELKAMTGLDLIFEIQANVGLNPNRYEQKEQTIEFINASMAASPMAYNEYAYFIEFDGSLSSGFYKFLAYMIPPEFSSSWWDQNQLNDVLGLSYKHIGVGDEFANIDERVGKLEMITAYNQFNDLILKLMIMVYNDEEVVAARETLMVFKGLVQCLILMTFFVTLYLVLFLEFWKKKLKLVLTLLKTMLPTLGFIGTILGLMRSLGNAYKIPIASGNANTSLAISDITTSLSIAFTTTLLAFVLLIFVDLLRVVKLRRNHVDE